FMDDVMCRMGRDRHIAAGDFMLALCSGFHDAELSINRKIDSLMIANLKMQVGMIFNTAPVTAKKRITTNEVNRTGNVMSVAFGHDEKNIFCHAFADQRIELPVQIRPPPF